MKITKKIKLFMFVLVFLMLIQIYQLSLHGARLNSLLDKLYHLLFDRYYQYEEVDYSINDTNSKYVLYECVDFCGGWADRLKGIMSAYAFSLLTKRQFRLYHTHPCKLTQLILPNKVNWNSKLTRNGQDLQLFSNLTRGYIYAIDKQDYKIKFSKENILNYESNKDVIIIQGNNDWLSSFAVNKYARNEILNLGLRPEQFNFINLFHLWYDDLFKLTPILQIKYDLIRQKARETNNTQIICAQIRIGGKRPNVDSDYEYNDLSVKKLFWKFIREKFISKIENDDWKLFISTDTETVSDEAIGEFGDTKVIKIPGLFTHIDREANLGNDCYRVEKTILDFHFMQNCDMAVISKSGYGKLGAWNRMHPLQNLFIFDSNNFIKAMSNLTV